MNMRLRESWGASNSPNLIASAGLAVVRARSVAPSFLGFAVQAERFIEAVIDHSVGLSYPAINGRDLARLMIALPPRNEQVAIAAFLDRESGKIDALVAEAERAIALLQERRAGLITAAVTGKIDVRGLLEASREREAER